MTASPLVAGRTIHPHADHQAQKMRNVQPYVAVITHSSVKSSSREVWKRGLKLEKRDETKGERTKVRSSKTAMQEYSVYQDHRDGSVRGIDFCCSASSKIQR